MVFNKLVLLQTTVCLSLGESVVSYLHRWARLLTQQSSITVHRLPTKENKLPFSAYVCGKRTEVCRFRLPLEANKRKLQFSVGSVFRWFRFPFAVG
jgi:hypothetical protein